MNRGDNTTVIRDTFDNGYMQAIMEKMFKLLPIMFIIMLSGLAILIFLSFIIWLLGMLNPYRTPEEKRIEEND